MTFNKQIQADLMELKGLIDSNEIDAAGVCEECLCISQVYHVPYMSICYKLNCLIEA